MTALVVAACGGSPSPTPVGPDTTVVTTPVKTTVKTTPTAKVPTSTPVPTKTVYHGARGANTVTEWNSLAEEAISGSEDAVTLALMHIAIHDALNSIDLRYKRFVVTSSMPDVSPEAAAASAAHTVLSTRLSSSLSLMIDGELRSSLDSIPDGPAKTQGIDFGNDVAQQVLKFYNPSQGPSLPLPTPGPGVWAAPAGVNSFPNTFPPSFLALTFTNVEQFRAPPPISLTSAEYAADFNEIKAIGSINSKTRTAEQTAIANFWRPTAFHLYFSQVARQLSAAKQLDLWDSARLFAEFSTVASDSYRAYMDTKHEYVRWRPQQAIRAGENDGNPDTVGDPSWQALIPSLSNPDYVSGHAASCNGISRVLQSFSGTDKFDFSIEIEGVTRNYSSLSSAADECAVSRIYGGSHFRKSTEAGAAQGNKVADNVIENFFTPVTGSP